MTQPAVSAGALAEADAVLRAQSPLHSLGRPRASLPSELAAAALRASDPPALHDAVVRGIGRVVDAIVVAFPHNLLWDLDALVGAQVASARAGADPVALFGRMAQLQHIFGERGNIRFRYVHDFIYGFDWAKWVAKAPARRASVGPFSPEFVTVMTRRGYELRDAIDGGADKKYPPLRAGVARNPFGFSREPAAELALHRALAAEGALPVEAWRMDATARWDEDFAARRLARAHALGLNTSS